MISRTKMMMLATTRRTAITTTRRQFQQMPPRLLVRSVTASNDTSAYNHPQQPMIALDCHTGDGSVPIYDATTNDQHQLKDIVDQNHLSSVVVSWPVQEQQQSTTSMLSRSILDNLTGTSFNSNESNTIKTTKPFYMLDGNGCRRASMCLVKGGSSLESTSPDHHQHHHPAAYQTPGTWLRQFSSLLRHQASVMMLQQ